MTIFSQLILFLNIPFYYLHKTHKPKTKYKYNITITYKNKSTSTTKIISINTFT